MDVTAARTFASLYDDCLVSHDSLLDSFPVCICPRLRTQCHTSMHALARGIHEAFS